MTDITFSAWLRDTLQGHGELPRDLLNTLEYTARACQEISANLARGALAGVLGQAGSDNVQGEAQKKLDVIANDILLQTHANGSYLASMASEEMDDPWPVENSIGRYLLVFDPLDGSSNIDINAPVGTIFSVLTLPEGASPDSHDAFLQAGSCQAAAGYALYGASTQLVLTLGFGVYVFTLDPRSQHFILTQSKLTIPTDTSEFAINMSNQRFWEPAVQRYIDELLAGREGPRERDFNMRWVAAMVADVHRILCRGGVFLYPLDSKTAAKGGKLRLLYEANPMGWLVQQAGGLVSTGRENILSIDPTGLHQRVPVILGAKHEVERLERYHREMN